MSKNKFFENRSDSDSSYDSDSSFSEEEYKPEVVEISRRAKWEIGNSESDSESDDDKVVIKSKEQKQEEDFRKLTSSLLEMMEFDDWIKVQEDFDKLQRFLESYTKQIPRFYIRMLCSLEDEIFEADRENITKGMNSSTAKAFNAMKQKTKKEATKRTTEMKAFRADPKDEFESEGEENEEQVVDEVVEKKITLWDQLEAEQKSKRKSKQLLEDLYAKAKTKLEKACILNLLVPLRIEQGFSLQSIQDVEALFDLISDKIAFGQDESSFAEKQQLFEKGEQVVLRGSPATYVDRLAEEFYKVLQTSDEHSGEYTEYLCLEPRLYSLFIKAREYCLASNQKEVADLILMRQVEHIYFQASTSTEEMREKTNILFGTQIDRIRTRALLCLVYHLALKDHFAEAKNIMLMSHIQDSINTLDVQTQVLYNRCLVQIGMSAFRKQEFKDCFNSLQEICSGKIQELLAQGVSPRYADRTVEQELLDKRRMLPFHLHLNLDKVESMFLVSAMLLEVPLQGKRKTFRKMLEQQEKQLFAGPPENVKDLVIQAAGKIAEGDWKQAVEYLTNINWLDVEPLIAPIKECALKTFVVTNGEVYENFAISELAKLFELSESKVTSVVSILISQGFDAIINFEQSIIIPKRSIEMNQASILADKLMGLLEANEKNWAEKTKKRVK